jgi:hypothetical protein
MTTRIGLIVLGLAMFQTCWADNPPKASDTSGAPAKQSAPSKQAAPDATPKPALATDDLDLLKALERQSAPTQQDENPLERMEPRMRDVQGRLAKADSGDETQILQKSIVDDLDTLIEQIKKGGNCPTCGAAQCNKHGKQKRQTSSQQPGQPSKPEQGNEPKEGQVTARPGTVSDEHKSADVRVVRNAWGHLPEKLREEMQQASQDSGLPKYRSLIELYFRAIAEQNESRRPATP